MAKQTNVRKRPSVGFYGEPGFVSLTTSLRKISGDDTIPTDKFVDIYKDLYDLITPDAVKSGISNIELSENKKKLIITYTDGTQKKLPLDEYVIVNTYFDKISSKAYFVFNNGEKFDLDLSELFELFATKEDIVVIREEFNTIVEEQITEIAGPLIEEKFGTEIEKIVEEKINTEIETIIEEKVEETFNDGITTIKWVNF